MFVMINDHVFDRDMTAIKVTTRQLGHNYERNALFQNIYMQGEPWLCQFGYLAIWTTIFGKLQSGQIYLTI